jgi:hypothetical protein
MGNPLYHTFFEDSQSDDHVDFYESINAFIAEHGDAEISLSKGIQITWKQMLKGTGSPPNKQMQQFRGSPLYTPQPSGTHISNDWIAYLQTLQPELRDMNYTKFNRFRQHSGDYDTYNLDVAFAELTDPPATTSNIGSLFQETNRYNCMDMHVTNLNL